MRCYVISCFPPLDSYGNRPLREFQYQHCTSLTLSRLLRFALPFQNPDRNRIRWIRGKHHAERRVRPDLLEVVQPLVQRRQPSRHQVHVVEHDPVTLRVIISAHLLDAFSFYSVCGHRQFSRMALLQERYSSATRTCRRVFPCSAETVHELRVLDKLSGAPKRGCGGNEYVTWTICSFQVIVGRSKMEGRLNATHKKRMLCSDFHEGVVWDKLVQLKKTREKQRRPRVRASVIESPRHNQRPPPKTSLWL